MKHVAVNHCQDKYIGSPLKLSGTIFEVGLVLSLHYCLGCNIVVCERQFRIYKSQQISLNIS